MNTQNWEEEYCKKFGLCDKSGTCQCKKEIGFISALLAQKEAEKQSLVKEMVEAVSRMRISVFGVTSDNDKLEYGVYNLAISDALREIALKNNVKL